MEVDFLTLNRAMPADELARFFERARFAYRPLFNQIGKLVGVARAEDKVELLVSVVRKNVLIIVLWSQVSAFEVHQGHGE